ncbi:MAG TPA: hypothetical protein VGM17_02175 [Rhizomicrobium sp.]|jgi:hypothetical protein
MARNDQCEARESVFAKAESRASDRAERENITSTVEQLDGVLVCALAACHAEATVPAAITGAIWAAARLASEVRRTLCDA